MKYIKLFENIERIPPIFSKVGTSAGLTARHTTLEELLYVKTIPNVNYQKFLKETFLKQRVKILTEERKWIEFIVQKVIAVNDDIYLISNNTTNTYKLIGGPISGGIFIFNYTIGSEELKIDEYINKKNELLYNANKYNL